MCVDIDFSPCLGEVSKLSFSEDSMPIKNSIHALQFLWCFHFPFLKFFYFMIAPVAHEVPQLGVESEMQLLAYATATLMWDLSHICNLRYSSWQCRILIPLSEARD